MKLVSKSFRVKEGDKVDDKQNARLIVSRIVLDTLEALRMTYPTTNEQRRAERLAIRRQLMAE